MHDTHSRHLMMVHIQECSLEQNWKWNIILNDFSYLLGSITTDDTGLLWIICMEKTKKNWKFNKTFAIYRIKTGNGINSKYHGRVIKISIYAMQHCSWILLGMQSAMLKRLAMKKNPQIVLDGVVKSRTNNFFHFLFRPQIDYDWIWNEEKKGILTLPRLYVITFVDTRHVKIN